MYGEFSRGAYGTSEFYYAGSGVGEQNAEHCGVEAGGVYAILGVGVGLYESVVGGVEYASALGHCVSGSDVAAVGELRI